MCSTGGVLEGALVGALVAGSATYAQAVTQYRSRKRVARASQDQARRDAIQQFDDVARARDAARREASERIRDSREKAVRARERARAARGEAGVSGLSVAALERDIVGAGLRAEQRVQAAYEDRLADLTAQSESAALGAERRMISLGGPAAPDPVPFLRRSASAVNQYGEASSAQS